MPYSEYLSWIKFITKNGSINPGRRLDKSLSLIAAHFSRAFIKFKDGRKADMNDFTLYPEKREEQYGGVDEVFAFLSSMAKLEDK